MELKTIKQETSKTVKLAGDLKVSGKQASKNAQHEMTS